MPLNIYYVRHGQSVGNEGLRPGCGLYDEESDPPLSSLGLEQARRLGERLASHRFDAIVCSPLERAIQTANEVALRQTPQAEIELLPDLMEFGTAPGYTGCPLDIIRQRFPLAVPCLSDPAPDGGGLSLPAEDGAAALARAQRVICYLRSRFTAGGDVLVTAHGSFYEYFFRAALGLSDTTDFSLGVDNASISRFEYEDGETVHLAFSNDTGHLQGLMPDHLFKR